MAILIIGVVLYLLATFVTMRILARRALEREQECVYSKKGPCDGVCKSIFCSHGHYLPVVCGIVAPLVWLFWASGPLLDAGSFGTRLRQRRHEHELAEEHHKTLVAQERVKQAEAVQAELDAYGLGQPPSALVRLIKSGERSVM